MKILILSCRTGEGHNSAAKAVKEALDDFGAECELVDALTFSGRRPNEIVTNSYNRMIVKAPNMFGLIYKAGDLYSSTKLASPVYWANSLYAERLRAYIENGGFTAVVCSHLFPMETLTWLKRRGEITQKCYGILTDYTCIPFFHETDLDAYFIPHTEVTEECLEKGMAGEKLLTTGIPVMKTFSNRVEKQMAREKLSIPAGCKLFLIMTGGIGCGRVFDFCDGILAKSGKDVCVIVLSGRNEQLKAGLNSRYGLDTRVRAVSFTTEVALYMNAADVLLTKPGGISTTEAAVANVPLCHTMPIPGCETKNAALFEKKGMSVRANSPQEAVEKALGLMEDNTLRERICKMQREQINPNASRDIAAYILSQ